MQTPTSPSLNEGIRRRKSKSASASLVDPSSPSKNYGTFSPFSPGSGRVKSTGSKSTLSKRSGSSNRKHQNRNSRLGFEDRIDEEDEEEDKEDDDEKRKAIRSLDVSTEIQKTIQSVTRNQTFRDVARAIATTIEQFASSPTFELAWPICFATFLVFWRASVIALHATAAVEQQQQQQQQRVLKVVEGPSLSEASVPRVSPPPPLPRERQRYRQPSETSVRVPTPSTNRRRRRTTTTRKKKKKATASELFVRTKQRLVLLGRRLFVKIDEQGRP